MSSEGEIVAQWTAGNILRDGIVGVLSIAGPTVIAWSGWLADQPFERDPQAWGPAGMAALEARLTRLAHETGGRLDRLWLRPHSRHILCDPHRCAGFLERHRSAGIGLAVDPMALLEAEMMDDAQDHLTRIIERLAPIAASLVAPREWVALDGHPRMEQWRRCGANPAAPVIIAA